MELGDREVCGPGTNGDNQLIAAWPGFNGIEVGEDGDCLVVPIVGWLDWPGEWAAIGADGQNISAVEWPDGRVCEDGRLWDNRAAYITYALERWQEVIEKVD